MEEKLLFVLMKGRTINKFDEAIIKKGVDLASRSTIMRRHASIIVERVRGKWKIIVAGYNEIFEKNGRFWSIHSEVAALRKLRKKNNKNYIMFNISIGKYGNVRISKPCANCARSLEKAGIDCYYTE